MIYAFNGAVCILIAFNFILMAFGAVYWVPRIIGCGCNSILSLLNLISIILMIGGATSTFGRICYYNQSSSSYNGEYIWSAEG